MRTLVYFAILFFSLCSFGQDNDPLTIKNWGEKDLWPKVEDDRSNIYKERLKDKRANLAGTPEKCLAVEVADRQYRIDWQPKWHYHGVGGPRLPDAAISPDRSIVALIENTGKPDAPSGSRIVLYNVYNFKVVKIIEQKECKISRICFIPDSASLACFVEAQKCFKQKPRLIIVDLATGENIGEAYLPEPVSDMASSLTGEIVAVRMQNGGISVFNTSDLKTPPRTVKDCQNGKCLTINSDRGQLVAPVGSQVKMFNLETLRPNAMSEFGLPAGFSPDKIKMIEEQSYILLEKHKKLLYARNLKVRTVADDPDITFDFQPETKTLAVGMLHKQKLQLYTIPGLEELKAVEPGNLRPKTRGDIIMLAFTTKAMNLIVLDNHGNLYLMTKPKRRWEKKLLISAKK